MTFTYVPAGNIWDDTRTSSTQGWYKSQRRTPGLTTWLRKYPIRFQDVSFIALFWDVLLRLDANKITPEQTPEVLPCLNILRYIKVCTFSSFMILKAAVPLPQVTWPGGKTCVTPQGKIQQILQSSTRPIQNQDIFTSVLDCCISIWVLLQPSHSWQWCRLKWKGQCPLKGLDLRIKGHFMRWGDSWDN
jgi:hypothetical protein